MAFDPLTWALGYVLKEGLNAAAKAAKGGQAAELQRDLQTAAHEWSRHLPQGHVVHLDSLFERAKGTEVLTTAARELVGNKLRTRSAPTVEEWLRALFERWEEVRATVQPGQRAPFFELPDTEARNYLNDLAERFEKVALGRPWLAGPAIVDQLRLLTRKTPLEASARERELLLLGEQVREQLQLRRQRRTAGREPFTFTVALAASYANLQQGIFLQAGMTPPELLSSPAPKILHGVGGAGKSQALLELGLAALDQGLTVFLVPLGERETRIPDDCTLSDLMKASIAGQADHLVYAGQQGKTLLLVDGLNELESTRREPIFNCLLDAQRDIPALVIVVADRMNPRGVPARFLPVGVDPLPREQVAEFLRKAGLTQALTEPELQLLSLPFFLDLVLSLLPKSVSLQAAPIRRRLLLESYLETVVGITEGLDRLAEAAFKAYEIHASRGFGVSWWEGVVEERIRDVLVSSGAIEHRQTADGTSVLLFRHQLLHDYLAGRYVAALGKERWTSPTFDAATFSTSSPESLLLAGECAGRDIDAFVEALYDWNYPTSIEAVSDLQRHYPENQVALDLRIIIPALNAEKLFDRFEHSRAGARKRMADTTWEEARAFERVESLDDLIQLVTSWQAPSERFERWRSLFAKTGEAAIEDREIGLLGGRPFEGWTASNVFRRLKLSEDLLARVRTIYLADLESDLAAVLASRRWRVVHLLGAFPSEANVDFLLRYGVRDTNHWVRYGAARSLMEISSYRSHAERLPILERLRTMVQETELLASPRILRELRTTTLISPGEIDPSWYDDIGPLLDAVHSKSREESTVWEVHLQKIGERKPTQS